MSLQILWIASLVVEVAAAFRVARSKARLPFLLAFLALDSAGYSVLCGMSLAHISYRRAWFIVAPLSWLLQTLMTLEIWRHWTRGYRVTGHFGIIVAALFGAIAVIASVAVSHLDWWALAWSGSLRPWYLVRRGIMLTLALFLCLVAWMVRRFPPDTSANLRRHTNIATLLSVALASQSLLLNLGGRPWLPWLQGATMLCGMAAYVSWAIWITPDGNPTATSPIISAEDIERFEAFLKGYMRRIRRTKE